MFLETLFWGSAAAALYHHAVYPALLGRLHPAKPDHAPAPTDARPTVSVIVAAYQEEAWIEAKVRNLLALDWPADRLRIRIVCDGCTDDTARLARAAIADHPWTGVDIVVEEHLVNRGKVAVLNEAIAEDTAELVLLTDASAALPAETLVRLAAHFADPAVGVAGGRYVLDRPGSPGEAVYWAYQTEIKRTEACLGSPMGFHGAGYMLRRDRWSPMAPDTINDDFVMPMRIVADGSRGVYDAGLQTVELERSRPGQEFRRRVRIGAGNLQQAIRLLGLADPRRPGLAFVFLSSKFLRAFMPLLLVAALLSSLALAFDGSPFFQAVAALQVAGYAVSTAVLATRELRWPRLLRLPAYLVEGYAAGLVGTLRYMAGRERGRWGRAGAEVVPDFVPPSIRWAKRAVDIVVASLVFVVFALTFPFVALAIRLDSKGPIFYRQLRVGEATPRFTRLFYMIKYRSMRIDAESSGAMWATSNDPRVTRVGRFMRKTRIDELPQCLNVLAGDMSVIGPRPERPSFFRTLEAAIPFYAERTYGIRPGISGLAQVNQGYDTSIEDVRSKVLHDHAYAMRLGSFATWLRADVSIIWRTGLVMVTGRGQ
ncbi:MAG: sugar transferase [Proteobacteria bacterium]|nr:sugar transferase [Pseudomonadota bacterium]